MASVCSPVLSGMMGLVAAGLVTAAAASDGMTKHAETLARVGAMSDEVLGLRLGQLLVDLRPQEELELDMVLSEIVRRRRPESEVLLRGHLEALMARTVKRHESDPGDPGSCYNLGLLTAIRRLEGRPDPLAVVVGTPATPLTCTPLSLPRLKVAVKNVDVENYEVGLTLGGDYRSGRQARWRLVVVNEAGEPLAVRPHEDAVIIMGGLYRLGVLKPGESWETVLDMRSFVAAPLPGKYRLEVLYHNTQTIVDMTDLSGLTVFTSPPIPLVVDPTVIELSAEDRRAAREWIAAIEPGETVKLVMGTYGEWAHPLIAPDTPEGKLLTMGLKAAPPLVAALQDETLSPGKRGTILALLYTLTGEHNPRHVLGRVEFANGPWAVWGGPPGEHRSGGMSFGGTGSSHGQPYLPGQQELVKKWAEWLGTVKVKEE